MYRRAAFIILQRSSRSNTSTILPCSNPRAPYSVRWLTTKRQQRIAAEKAQSGAESSSSSKETSFFTASSPLPSTFIKTDLTEHVDWMKTQYPKFDPHNPPPDRADESGVVKRDLTQEMIDLTDIYDPRMHLNPEFDSTYESATPLSDEIIQLLAVTNRPMTCAEFMRQALTHPSHGYYTNPTKEDDDDDDWDDNDDDWDKDDNVDTPADGAHSIIGPRGDFVTAPEVSQVFGECLAVWYVTQWETLGKPQALRLIEVGPGKGTLMADIVRASLQAFHYFGSCIQEIHLVEKSPAMREEQQKRLSEIESAIWVFQDSESNGKKGQTKLDDKDVSFDDDKPAIHVSWHDTFLDMVAATKDSDKKIPSFVVCQEFLDVLPVHVFEKTRDGWRERLVDANVDSNEDSKYDAAQENLSFQPDKKPRLRFVVSPGTTPALRTLLNMEKDDYEEGQVVEVCPDAILFAQDVAKLLQEQGGAALIIDYGQEGTGDTLRGFSNHKQVHVLSRPGMVDVTADVDFAALKHAVNHLKKGDSENIANPPQAFGPVPQGQFLGAMGIVERVSQLIDDDTTTDKQANDLYMALERLVLPEQMGERYKVMAIAKKKQGVYPPTGFDTMVPSQQ